MNYKFTITRNSFYGHQAERHYEIVGEYFTVKIKYFGNQGFDAPQIIRTESGSNYFHSLNSFMKEFYNDKLWEVFSSCKDGEKKSFEVKRYF